MVWTTGKILCALGVVGNRLVRFGRLAFDRKAIFALIMGAAAATTHLAVPTGALLTPLQLRAVVVGAEGQGLGNTSDFDLRATFRIALADDDAGFLRQRPLPPPIARNPRRSPARQQRQDHDQHEEPADDRRLAAAGHDQVSPRWRA